MISWLGFVLGIGVVLFTFGSVINTLVVPRGTSSRITSLTWRKVRLLFIAFARLLRSYEAKDRLLALVGPVSLLILLGTWLILFLLGYGLILWPIVHGGLAEAIRMSGSSILTLGIASSTDGAPTAIIFMAATTGLVAIALLIGYLPTIYGAFNRRETLVTMLESRAGEPAWGPELLAREAFINGLDTLPALYSDWERWAADLAESHVNYPWLMFFRSPHPLRSWIVALLAVMDSAALYLALSPEAAPSEARSCLRMGFTALRSMADALQIRYNPDPLPTDPIELPFEDFAQGVARIQLAGFPIERSMEEAWVHFRGWRVNYESIAYGIADTVSVVPALWSGPRTLIKETSLPPKRPAQRSPQHPEGVARAEEKATRLKVRSKSEER